MQHSRSRAASPTKLWQSRQRTASTAPDVQGSVGAHISRESLERVEAGKGMRKCLTCLEPKPSLFCDVEQLCQ
jgi:hypothetical protein